MDQLYGVWILATAMMVLGGLLAFMPRFVAFVARKRRIMLGIEDDEGPVVPPGILISKDTFHSSGENEFPSDVGHLN
jgi:hypothetical protein